MRRLESTHQCSEQVCESQRSTPLTTGPYDESNATFGTVDSCTPRLTARRGNTGGLDLVINARKRAVGELGNGLVVTFVQPPPQLPHARLRRSSPRSSLQAHPQPSTEATPPSSSCIGAQRG